MTMAIVAVVLVACYADVVLGSALFFYDHGAWLLRSATNSSNSSSSDPESSVERVY